MVLFIHKVKKIKGTAHKNSDVDGTRKRTLAVPFFDCRHPARRHTVVYTVRMVLVDPTSFPSLRIVDIVSRWMPLLHCSTHRPLATTRKQKITSQCRSNPYTRHLGLGLSICFLPFHKLSRFGNTFCKYFSMFCKTIRYSINVLGCFISHQNMLDLSVSWVFLVIQTKLYFQL